ncbi:MAG: DnaJ domain-containing protein [Deltaproteobacteria bacterium]
MASLSIGLVSIARTKRGRYFWAAWWTATPVARPYLKPDASNGGESTHEAARLAAERAAGCALAGIDSRWAGAWIRTLRGGTPWPSVTSPTPDLNPPGAAPRSPRSKMDAPPGSRPWARELLAIKSDATLDDIKAAFRIAALRTHPDRGGDEAAFIAARRAYEVALTPAASQRRKRRQSGP